jgi:hypothetical protein
MAAISTKLTRVRICATENGTYVLVAYVRDFQLTEGEEGGGVTRYMGGEIDAGGDATLTATMPCLFDRTDTTGQEALRAAKRSGSTYWLQFCPGGTATGAKCEQFEARVTEVTIGSPQDEDWVTGSFSFRGVPSTLETVTLA